MQLVTCTIGKQALFHLILDAATESENKKGGQHRSQWYKKFHPDEYKNSKRCAIMEQSSRTTGAIGDLNNDNKLDLILTFNAQGIIDDVHGNYIRAETTIDLVAIDIEANFQSYPILNTKDGTVTSSKKGSQASWKSKHLQQWTGYMGANSLSSYHALQP